MRTMKRARQPCKACPWRVGVDAWALGRDDGSPLPPLHHSEMVRIANCQNEGFNSKVMACHEAVRDELVPPHSRVCVGFALSRDAGENISFRLLTIRGGVDPTAFDCPDELHPSFDAMLAANPARGSE